MARLVLKWTRDLRPNRGTTRTNWRSLDSYWFKCFHWSEPSRKNILCSVRSGSHGSGPTEPWFGSRVKFGEQLWFGGLGGSRSWWVQDHPAPCWSTFTFHPSHGTRSHPFIRWLDQQNWSELIVYFNIQFLLFHTVCLREASQQLETEDNINICIWWEPDSQNTSYFILKILRDPCIQTSCHLKSCSGNLKLSCPDLITCWTWTVEDVMYRCVCVSSLLQTATQWTDGGSFCWEIKEPLGCERPQLRASCGYITFTVSMLMWRERFTV